MVFFSTSEFPEPEKNRAAQCVRLDAPIQPAFTFPMAAILTIRSGK
jgi:hypothetical protein